MAIIGANTTIGRVRETVARWLGVTVVSEMIGRTSYPNIQMSLYRARGKPLSIDYTINDYEFYDSLRRCQAEGYKLGGLFAKRVERIIASWVLGDGLTIELYSSDANPIPAAQLEYTNARLAEFVANILDAGADDDQESEPDRDDRSASLLGSSYRDAMGLGDGYLIVNADGSISVPSPETVAIEHDPLDYRRWVAVTVTTKLPKITVEDQYRADGRTLTMRRGNEIVEQIEYENLIGRIPVVHVAHERGTNEVYGHSIHEELIELYSSYDDILYKQIEGADLLGKPIPAFVGMEDVTQVFNANDPVETDTYTDKDYYTEDRPQFKMDRNALLLIGKGGDFKFVAPPVGFYGRHQSGA